MLKLAFLCSVEHAEAEGWALLGRMKADLRLVGAELLSAIRAWFVAHGPRWTASTTTVDDEGTAASDTSIRLLPVLGVRIHDARQEGFVRRIRGTPIGRLILLRKSAMSLQAPSLPCLARVKGRKILTGALRCRVKR
jgi:hypothetical protein